MTNTNRKKIREFADQIADRLIKIDDEKVEIKALVDAAKEQDINTKALLKVAKELAMESDKVAKALEFQDQLDLFRVQVELRQRKGLDDMREAAE